MIPCRRPLSIFYNFFISGIIQWHNLAGSFWLFSCSVHATWLSGRWLHQRRLCTQPKRIYWIRNMKWRSGKGDLRSLSQIDVNDGYTWHSYYAWMVLWSGLLIILGWRIDLTEPFNQVGRMPRWETAWVWALLILCEIFAEAVGLIPRIKLPLLMYISLTLVCKIV